MGISCRDVGRMQQFYTEVLGFTITDIGHAEGMDLVFLSRDPNDHHQIVLAGGRPEEMPANTANPQLGPSINQNVRASCRDRVFRYVKISVVAVSVKQKK